MTRQLQHPIAEPTFLLTFDTELLWALRLVGWSDTDREAAHRTRNDVLPALLSIIDEFGIPATFAIVGHLLREPQDVDYPSDCFDDEWTRRWYSGIAEAFAQCPEGFYWPDLPSLFEDYEDMHEFALHSFTHWHFERTETTEDIAIFEVEMNRTALRDSGLEPGGAVVFPRNSPGYLETLRDAGITAYRGMDPNWYAELGGGLNRIGHVIDCLLTIPPPVTTSLEDRSGVLDVTGSYLFWASSGFRRWIPQYCRAQQIEKGITRCIDQCGLFHFWMHPIDLAYDTSVVLGTLRKALERIAHHRDAGELRVMTMSEVASQYAPTAQS